MQYTIPLIYLTTFLFLFGETLQPAPRIKIYEDVICRKHYGSTAIVYHNCKISPVQQELVLLIGLERFSIIIPSLLAIPFAALADKFGHAFILSIALFGLFLEEFWPLIICWFPNIFSIRLIWLHFVFSFIGGGMTVIVTLLHVIVADHVPANIRTTVFFRMRAAGVGASVLGYAAAGASMKLNVWLPWWIGLLSILLAMFTSMMLPNTTAQGPPKSDSDAVENWREWLSSSLQFLKRVYALLMGNKQIRVILVLVFLCQLGFDSIPLMMAVYVSKRFHWDFSNASFLNSLDMGVELITLLIFLPLVESFLLGRGFSNFSRINYIAQGSVAALAVGALCLGFAPVVGLAIVGIIVMALGTGQDSTLRSMATDMVDASGLSIVYSAITMLRAIGGSISGPIYAGLYDVGMRNSGVWLGLPFMTAGLLFTVAFLLLILLKDESGYEAIRDQEDEDN
ncbi:MFS general substrate transporter [Melanomma pulvis-pyrius CBS 109.77]|uniref:MFS general substrate transporter n=1 Tax=Melanomma pulvis-pyrius CBS 109.77 TaxID=1314802 RepID=A0A6A6XBP9_9PLEO|nr:MFS general substrate transporter [Melanomma pulvis-pyrius CBS 109.77]